MFMRLLSIILILSLSSLQAHADWVEARSDNFIFQGDVSEKRAKLVLNNLEEYRTILFKVLKLQSDVPEVVPVQIYGLKSGGFLRKVKSAAKYKNAAGVYLDAREGPVFFLDISGPFAKGSQARQIAYHEYTHHIISTYTNIVYPRWYNEGYAEYLSTFDVNKKGVVSIGLPNEGRGLSLAYAGTNGSWFDMKTMTESIRVYPWKKEGARKTLKNQSLFYAQSWLAVHYLISTEEYASKLDSYLQALNQANRPDDVFETSFGISPKEFGELLRTYHKKNRYKGFAIKLNDNERNYDIKVKKLSKAESDFHRGEVIRRFVRGDEKRPLSEKYYARAIDGGFAPAQVMASRALTARSANDEAGALNNINQALSFDNQNSRILQIAGDIYLSQYKNDKTPSNLDQIKKSRAFLKQAIRANPQNMKAHYDYVSTYATVKDQASKQAIYSAGECAYHFRGNNFINSNIKLAEILAKNGKYDAARSVLKKAMIWSSSKRVRAQAKRALEALP